MRTLAAVFGALLITSLSPRAEACINAVEVTRHEALARIFAVDAAMHLEQYWFANLMIPVGKYGNVGFLAITDEPPPRELRDESDLFEMRLVDAQRVIEMRWGEPDEADAIRLERYFRWRLESDASPRFTAWRAEALVLLGSTDAARELLRGLESRDLMPEAHAYATLATLTTGAEQRRAAQTCRVRALVKTICPPAPTTI